MNDELKIINFNMSPNNILMKNNKIKISNFTYSIKRIEGDDEKTFKSNERIIIEKLKNIYQNSEYENIWNSIEILNEYKNFEKFDVFSLGNYDQFILRANNILYINRWDTPVHFNK
jgi:hypothetical protein